MTKTVSESGVERAGEPAIASLAVRGSLGGLLMGLANLVPGISGGTMLLAAGVYRRFIDAVAEVTTLRFRLRSVVLLGVIAGSAGLAILLLAGPVESLVTQHRWIMYSAFLGLTLGGAPVVWRMAKPGGTAFGVGTAAGFALMAVMAFTGTGGEGGSDSVLLVIAGMAAASAMILPGVSGAYLFLVMGQYERILGAIDSMKQGAVRDAMPVIVPVGIGVAVGVALVSNLVRWTLRHHEQATLGVLMGLLFGSVIGIFPFREMTPAVGQVAGALGLCAAGFLVTRIIDRIGAA
jgi:putative membrane protein